MKNNLLKKEIVRHIFSLLGLSPVGFGKIAITHKDFLSDKTVDIEYNDNKIINHNVFVSQIKTEEFTIKFLVIDLTIDNNLEAVLVIKMNDLPLHIMRLSYAEGDQTEFQIVIDNKSKEAELSIQCQLLLGIEQIISLGLAWEKLDDFEVLRTAGLLICQE